MTKVFSVVVKKLCIFRDSENERKGAKGVKRLEEDGKLNYEELLFPVVNDRKILEHQ